MIVDTHCHLSMIIEKDDTQSVTQKDLDKVTHVMQDAAEHNVQHLVSISTTRESMYANLAFAQSCEAVSAAIGLHPCDYSNTWQHDISELQSIVSTPAYRPYVSAIGECGLDFHHSGYNVEEQTSVFKAQIEVALEHDLPIVVHSRKATQEALRVIEPYVQDGIRGVIHCYAGDAALAQEIRDKFGMYIGIAGPITYPKNDALREAVKAVGAENILLETDAPFLPPQVIRGKRNHPLYTSTIAQQVADVLDVELNTVEQVTTANARELFALSV